MPSGPTGRTRRRSRPARRGQPYEEDVGVTLDGAHPWPGALSPASAYQAGTGPQV